MARTRRKKEPTPVQDALGGLADGLLMLLVFIAVVYAVSRAVQAFDPIIQDYIAGYERKKAWGF